MRVKDVMTPDPTTISPQDSLQTALEKMSRIGRRLPVIDKGRLIGIITDRDLRLAMNSPQVLRERWQDDYLLQQTKVEDCMTRNPVTVQADDPLQDAANKMLQGRFSGLPVLDDGGILVGIITVTDLVRALIRVLTIEKL